MALVEPSATLPTVVRREGSGFARLIHKMSCPTASETHEECSENLDHMDDINVRLSSERLRKKT